MNPWLILGIVLALACSFSSGAYFGYDYRDGKVAKEVAAAQKSAIAEHNADALIDMQAAYERGQAEAKVRVITRTIQGEANAITASAPIPVTCRLDAPRMKLLQRSIEVANGDKMEIPSNK